jgi:CheY-like chemotaxis protein
MASKRTILVADDTADEIFFLSRALEKSGLNCSLVAVKDGEEAVTYLSKEQPPNLLLLDLNMPKMDGFEVLQWIKDKPKLRELPVVVFSSSDREEDRSRALELGAQDYIVKTARQDELKRMFMDLYSRFFAVCK